MKALAFTEFGGPQKLALLDVPDPVPGLATSSCGCARAP